MMKLVNFISLLLIGTFGCQPQTTTAPHPILATIKAGNLPQVEKFLAKNKDINTHYAGYTLLCAAVKTNQKEIATYLIKKGADLNKMSNKKTPLIYAAKYGRLDLAKFLIEENADKTVVNPRGKTALDYAHKYKQPTLIALLSK